MTHINVTERLIEPHSPAELPLTTDPLVCSTTSMPAAGVAQSMSVRSTSASVITPQPEPITTIISGTTEIPSLRKLPVRTQRSGNNGAKVRCDYCPKLFINRSKMLGHRRMHESNRLRYACPQPNCDRIYLSKQSCDLHYKQAHCTPEQFDALQCHVCHKHFAIPHTLEVHMRYHTRDFPFECPLCSKKFAQKGHLTAHLQVRHHNLRYACTEPGCTKVFKNSISLRNHCFVHTGMPFRCAYCDKGYPQKSKLKVHISTKHNVEMSIDELESMRKFTGVRTRHSFVRLEGLDEGPPEVGDQYECGEEEVGEDSLDSLEHNQLYEDAVEEIEVTL